MILIERTFCAAAIQPPLGSEDQHLENLAINPEQLREEIGSKIKFHGKKKPLKYFAALGKRLKAGRGSNCNEIKHRAQLFQAVLHLVWREALKLANEFII